MSGIKAEIEILDYTNSQIVTFDTGIAEIQTGAFKLIHISNVEKYENILTELKQQIANKINIRNPLLPALRNEIEHIQSHIKRIRPTKYKRSINEIGTAWKWLSGSPDHDDFAILYEKTNNILQNSNKQVVINKQLETKLNTLTNVTNMILSTVKANDHIQHDMAQILKYKLNLIKEEIINLEYAINWAKADIINPYILSDFEIKEIEKHMRNLNFYSNIEEMIQFANIKIATNKLEIMFIITIPTTNGDMCNSKLIKPLKKNNLVNKIDYNNIIVCKSKTYAIKEKCLQMNNKQICNSKNIVDITKTGCIPNLLSSQISNCKKINDINIPTIENIAPGTILLNNFDNSIKVDDKIVNLKGNFVITFGNVTVEIDKYLYNFNEKTMLKPSPAIVQPQANATEIEEILNLETMKLLHINNTKRIEELQSQNTTGLAINFGVTSLIILILAILLVVKLVTKSRSIQIENNINATPLEEIVEPSLSTLQLPSQAKPKRLNQIPFF